MGDSSVKGLVLSGGGMRGAYEAGAVAGIMEALGRKSSEPPLFQVFSGTSVGAINCAFFASHAHLGDHGAGRLVDMWKSLELSEHLRIRPLGLLRTPSLARELAPPFRAGRSLLDSSRIEAVVRGAIDFDRLHHNVRDGLVHALLISALHVVSGRTTVFADVSPGASYSPSPARVARFGRIGPSHVLASAAIPLLFPTREIDGRFYCDGGLRFNTPIAPAIRAGAERLVVVAVGHQRTADEQLELDLTVDEAEARDIGTFFLLGKLLNALLLDPVHQDLAMLSRLNEVVDVLRASLSTEQFERVQEVLVRVRGVAYRPIQTLVLRPSQDLGQLAGRFLQHGLERVEVRPLLRRLLRAGARGTIGREADWASYLLFDGAFAGELLELGRQDALDKAREIRDLLG